MVGRGLAAAVLLCGMLYGPVTTLAADAGQRIDAARQAVQKGDLPRAVQELEAALTELQSRLGKSLASQMPAAPANWKAEPAEVQGLGAVGGGLAVTRAYVHDESTMNASLIIDSPAVEAAAALLANEAASAAQPNMTRVKVGAEDALLRWDGSIRSGEITMVLGTRVLLEIQGDNLKSGDVLVNAAKGWNLAGIRKVVGI